MNQHDPWPAFGWATAFCFGSPSFVILIFDLQKAYWKNYNKIRSEYITKDEILKGKKNPD